jgi:hypothetical protein
MHETDIAHLAGVFDAVGTATVHVSKNDKYRIGYRYQPVIRLHRPIDEEAMMGKVMAYADEAGVRYHVKEKSGSGDGPSSNVFSVNDAENIQRFLEPLTDYLVTALEPSLILLEDVLPAVQQGEHHTKAGFLSLMAPAERLREASHHGPEPKYTKSYFEELWEEEATSA